MSSEDFHSKPFDEGTLTKLEIFELYTREWLPVFLANEPKRKLDLHLFDFFSGPGSDQNGVHGSPLRTLGVLREYSSRGLAGWGKVGITVHCFDASPRKIRQLKETVACNGHAPAGVGLDIQRMRFADAFTANRSTLCSRDTAKLLLIDQCGVRIVNEAVFRELISFRRTDFLFFVSSATLHRFRSLPVIKQKIPPTADYYQVHRAVLEYYRSLLPLNQKYYLAPFSIKKGSNIYGIIFGSAHPLGIDKFLNIAWRKDHLNGAANFDVNRDNLLPDEPFLELDDLFRPSKVTEFERDLEHAFRSHAVSDELAVMEICFAHGVTRKHAKPVIAKMKKLGVIEAEFQTPDVSRLEDPRGIRYL